MFKEILLKPEMNKSFWVTFGLILFFQISNDGYLIDSLISSIFWAFGVWILYKYFIEKIFVRKNEKAKSKSEVIFLARNSVQSFLEDNNNKKQCLDISLKFKSVFIEEIKTRCFMKDIKCEIEDGGKNSEKLFLTYKNRKGKNDS